MNIVFINQFIPPDPAPTGQLLWDVAGQLAGEGHTIHVLASASRYAHSEAGPQNALPGLHVQRLGSPRRHATSLAAKLADYGMFYRRACQALRRLQPAPDLLVCLTTPPFAGCLAHRFHKQSGTPYVIWAMDLYPEALQAHGMLSETHPLYRKLLGIARHERADAAAILSLGPDMTHRLREDNPGIRIEEIPPWTGLSMTPSTDEKARALRRLRGWYDHEHILLYSGNMGRAHRIDEFLHLDNALRETGTPGHLVFCGKGPRRTQWEQQANGQTEFIHPVPEADTAAHLRAADVHLVSQDPAWRGVVVPSKLQAACAVGRPVIFAGPSDSSVGQWLRETGAGWILEPGDAEAPRRVATELADPETRARRADAAAALGRDRFSRGNALDRIVPLLESIAREGAPA